MGIYYSYRYIYLQTYFLNRPSSAALLESVKEGVISLGGKSKDYGKFCCLVKKLLQFVNGEFFLFVLVDSVIVEK